MWWVPCECTLFFPGKKISPTDFPKKYYSILIKQKQSKQNVVSLDFDFKVSVGWGILEEGKHKFKSFMKSS